MLIGFLIPHNKMATIVAFCMRNLTDLKSNSRPINNGLEKMVCILSGQNPLIWPLHIPIIQVDTEDTEDSI